MELPILRWGESFQFLGIPPKGEQAFLHSLINTEIEFPISRDPPEGGTRGSLHLGWHRFGEFPISRDPPEGGTPQARVSYTLLG